MANRNGDFGSATAFTGTVNGPYLAQILTQRLGHQVTQGEPFAQVFPNGIVPQNAWGTAPTRMLQYIPKPNVGLNQFSTGAYKERINDNKAAGRVDFNSPRFGTSSIYYFNDRYNLPDADYAAHGGCFPIHVIGAGIIGAVTVSGLPQREDHNLAVEAICLTLNLDPNPLRLP